MNPIRPVYRQGSISFGPSMAQGWECIKEGLYALGHFGNKFAFDNESPAHKTYIQASQIAQNLVTNAEFRAFIDDGGYKKPALWLSNGWNAVQTHEWEAPLYWEKQEGEWFEFTLYGDTPLIPSAPVCHISYYEADAFARWAGYRLPTEAEWEIKSIANLEVADLIPQDRVHPSAGDKQLGINQLFGEVWQWTKSPYIAYPGFSPSTDAIGEYNGKFMCDQWVLRGSSCVTPRYHARPTYRNFFPSSTRWQFSGLRLARDVGKREHSLP